MSSSTYTVMVDMDHTLIESVFPGDPRYNSSTGKIIHHDDPKHDFKVNIRPGAPDMIREIVSLGYIYILWSAGTYKYVHSVMTYFSEVAGVTPSKIYTREDMVPVETDRETILGNKFKSNTYMGVNIDNLLIIEDDPTLVNPFEHGRIIKVRRWAFEMIHDKEMDVVISLLRLYSQTVPAFCTMANPSDDRVLRRCSTPHRSRNFHRSNGRYKLVSI